MAGGRIEQVLATALCTALLLAGCAENPTQKAYRQGVRAFKRGNYERCIALLQKSAELGGTNVPAASIYNGLGLAYSRIGQQENAMRAFDQSARLDPRFAAPVYNIGVMLVESGRAAQAAPFFEKASQLESSDTRALEYLGRLFRLDQRWDDARRVLNEAQQRAPREPRILTALALIELHADNVVRAISSLQEALEHDTGYAPALYNLALVNHRWLKNDSQAASLFKEYLRLAPEGANATNALQALALIEKPAERQAEVAASAVPPAVEKPVKPVKAAVDRDTAKKAEKIEPVVQTATSVQPPSFEELMRAARLLEKNGRIDAAVGNYLLAAREGDRAGKPSMHAAALETASRICAPSAWANYEVGLYWAERGQPDKAIAHLKEAVKLSNTWYEAHMALARVSLDRSEFDTAVVSLKQADHNSPDRPEALWMLANLYDHHLGLTNQAMQVYDQFARRFVGDQRNREGTRRMELLRGNADTNEPGTGKTEMQARWQWLFKPRSQKQPEN